MNKQNISLYIGIAIPVLMVMFVAGSVYLPRLFSTPQYSFLYATGVSYHGPAKPVILNRQDYDTQERYVVRGERLVKETVKVPLGEIDYTTPFETKLYLQNTQTNASQEISFDEAQKLRLNTEALSPDGYKIARGSGGGGVFPFFFNENSDFSSYSLIGHGARHKLNLKQPADTQQYYYDKITFLGWVMP